MSKFISLKAPQRYAKRQISEPKHSFRTDFMRDRDRVLYSKSFRRLSGKTQIFVSGYNDHTRTRLTHTLEVSQIARTISRRLNLDEDLTEAIALGHDLGHTPFGHVGERTLNFIMNGCEPFSSAVNNNNRGFKHNLQSVRVVSKLQDNKAGLNLTNYSLYGLYKHSKPDWIRCDINENRKVCDYFFIKKDDMRCNLSNLTKECKKNGFLEVPFYKNINNLMLQRDSQKLAWSFEAFVVAISDEIAQRHHDLEDALEADLMNVDEIISLFNSFTDFFSVEDKNNFKSLEKSENNKIQFVSNMSRFIVNFLVNQLCENSNHSIKLFMNNNDINSYADYEEIYPNLNENNASELVRFSNDFSKVHSAFENNLRNRILNSYAVQRMDGKGSYIIRRLFKAYLTNPQQLPDKTIVSVYKQYNPGVFNKKDSVSTDQFIKIIGSFRDLLEEQRHSYSSNNKFKNALLRVICDHIAGMTDAYAINEYHKLYG